MHNLFANAGDLTFDSDGWISFWQSIHDLESTWPETTGEQNVKVSACHVFLTDS